MKLREPFHEFEKRLAAAAKRAKSDPAEYGVEMFLAGIEYVAFSEGSPKIGDPKLAERIRGLITQSRNCGINGRNATGHARFWAKSIINPMSEQQWKESGMLEGFNEKQRCAAIDMYNDIYTSHGDETFIWHCIPIARIVLQRIWSSDYDHLYPSMKDRNTLHRYMTLRSDIMRKVEEQIEKGGKIIHNHEQLAHECLKHMIDEDHLINNGRNGSPVLKEAMATLMDIATKQHREKKGGWQTCDARDVIFLAAHQGLEPVFVGDGFSGGIILHYENGDRAVDVMFDKRERKDCRRTVVSLCEAETSDTPFIPFSTIDATSHEQVIELLKGHLQ